MGAIAGDRDQVGHLEITLAQEVVFLNRYCEPRPDGTGLAAPALIALIVPMPRTLLRIRDPAREGVHVELELNHGRLIALHGGHQQLPVPALLPQEHQHRLLASMTP